MISRKIVYQQLDNGGSIMQRVNKKLDLFGYVINQNNFKLQKKSILVWLN